MSPFDKEATLNILYQSDVKLTAQAYIKEIKSRFSISSVAAKKRLKQLVDEQELSYHYLYGTTYVEQSFLKPVRVSNHFVLKPPGVQGQTGPSGRTGIELVIEPGISFGSGQHPTTRLCLAAIDFCFFERRMIHGRHRPAGADIGTGSGVLALALCLSGLASCRAYEIDPVSVNEARRNVALNHLAEKINIIEEPMTEHKKAFSIISANLRFPTLKTLSGMISASLTDTGIAVLSGVRQWEKEALVDCYAANGFEPVWQEDEKKWSAFVLVKKVC